MKNQELNLLHIFDVIMTERSVTRAAAQLATTQPAVSNAISRMRDLWHDPLFIKSGRNIEPTAYAHSLWRRIRKPLLELNEAVNLHYFDPASSHRQFKIAISDFAAELIWLPLIEHMQLYAPNIDIYAAPFSVEASHSQLKDAQIDLALGPLSEPDRSFRSLFLFQDDFILAMNQNHPLAKKGHITMDDFLAAKHLLVTSTHHASGIVDQILSNKGLSRRIATTVNHFSTAPKILQNTDLIAAIPRVIAGTAEYQSGLVLMPHPLAMQPFPIYLTWHARNDADSGLQWFKQLFVDTLSTQFNRCYQHSEVNLRASPRKLSA